MLSLVRRALTLRAEHECLRHDQWFADHADEDRLPKVTWLGLDGQGLQPQDWQDVQHRSLVCRFSAPKGPSVLAVFHPHAQEAVMPLQGRWRVALDTTQDDAGASISGQVVERSIGIAARSVVVLLSVP